MGKDSLFVLVIWEKCIGSLTKRTLCNTTLRQSSRLVSSLSLKKHTQPDFIRNWSRKHQMYFRNLNMRSMFTIIHGHGLYWVFNQLMSMVFVFILKKGVGDETCWIHSAVISSICFKVPLELPWYSIICRTGKNRTKRCEGNLTTGLCQSRAIGLLWDWFQWCKKSGTAETNGKSPASSSPF